MRLNVDWQLADDIVGVFLRGDEYYVHYHLHSSFPSISVYAYRWAYGIYIDHVISEF